MDRRAYLDTIPRDLDDAAKADGTGPMGAFIRVVIPAAVPGIVAVLIYAFMTAWSEMLFASVLTNDSTRTLAVGLQGYATQNQGLLEPDHGRVADRERAHRGRVPAAAALPGGWHDGRLGQIARRSGLAALVSASADQVPGDSHIIVTVTVLGDDAGDCLAAGEDFALWRGADIGRGVVTRRVFV